MATTRSLSIVALGLALGAAGCNNNPTYTVGGRTLEVVAQNFGRADYYCPNLANGQFLVILSSFGLCEATPGANARQVLHAATETNMRLVFPKLGLTKIPPTHKFTVGKSDCRTFADPGTEALAYFSHHEEGQAEYVLNKQATGTITVEWPDPDPDKAVIVKGSFDLSFDGEKVTGSFEAPYCNGINAEYNK